MGLDGYALVIGAGGGLGRETAYSFAEAGVSGVCFSDIDEKSAREAAETSKRYATNSKYRALVVPADVSNLEQAQNLVDAAVKEFGKLDYGAICHGVDIGTYDPISEASVSDFSRAININVTGVMISIQVITKAMLKQEPRTVKSRNGERDLGRGSIVVISSANGYRALPAKSGYVTSKHAVLGLVKTAGLDNAPHRIRVNAVCPSWVTTPMLQTEFKKLPDLQERIKRTVPLGRVALPEEVADVVLFLCGSGGSYINGEGVVIDGGTITKIGE